MLHFSVFFVGSGDFFAQKNNSQMLHSRTDIIQENYHTHRKIHHMHVKVFF